MANYYTTSAATTTVTAWYVLCDSTVTSTAATWTSWCDSGVYVASRPSGAEVRAATEAACELARNQVEADRRAQALLLEHLDAAQKDEYRRHQRFTVRRDRRRYVVRHGLLHNVDRVGEDGRITHNVCAYFAGVPLADHLLAQKLALEADDEAFCARGNVFGARGDYRNGQTVLPALN